MKEKEINVLYLVWGESIAYYGVFDNQVMEQIIHIQKLGENVNIDLLTGIALTKKLLQDRKAYTQEVNNKKEYLKKHNINMRTRWIFMFTRFFYSNVFTLPFFHIGHLFYLRRLVKKNNYHIIHCRMYHAALLASLVRKIFKLKYKIIFDPRSLLPEEAVVTHILRENGWSYRLWKYIEKKLFDTCDAVVNVSDTFTEHVSAITRNPNLYTIPTSTNIEVFKGRDPEKRKAMRTSLGIGEQEKVLVFVGALNLQATSVEALAGLYLTFRDCFSHSKLLVINRLQDVTSALVEQNVPVDEIIIARSASDYETWSYLQVADYAAFPFKKVSDKYEEAIGTTTIACKTGEYLASGLPILVNEKVGAVHRLIKENQLGCVYSIGQEEKIKECLKTIESRYDKVSQQSIHFAQSYFSTQDHANQYLSIYTKLAS